ncbi:hypothetical protein AB1046_10340 [Promicromonospora sp. Populi]|uniref:hypothetical protein n=1 Tax=Promicromonospora sp. Populi TaxID=3239420 RepID=UPI0034E255B1
MRATMRRFVSVLAVLVLGAAGFLAVAPTAAADVTYVPETWNGKVIYLSEACHDRGDTVCHTNTGCDGFSENANAFQVAVSTATQDDPDQLNLLERGYKVVRGNGLTRRNIANSNRLGADLHLPIHSNAISKSCETGFSPERYGTHVMYVSPAGERCAEIMTERVGAGSPGTNDARHYRSDLGELNQTNAPACYLEQEFHVWDKGVAWMRNHGAWTWRIAQSVDVYMGYP